MSENTILEKKEEKEIIEISRLLGEMPENMRLLARGFLIGVTLRQEAEVKQGLKELA